MAKTRRFGDLVRESGRPEVATLWTDPRKDRTFSKAIRENRVLTVESNPTSKRKDSGRIGFHQVQGGIYLVFPEALPKDTDSRIVGINYQLTDERPPKDPVTSEFEEELTRKAKARKEKAPGTGNRNKMGIAETTAPPPKPKLKTFEITVRRIATVEEKRRVKAETEEAAKAAALEAVKGKRLKAAREDVRDEIVEVAEVV
jgi:hypothetical protein